MPDHVSVILPAYNAEGTVAAAARSILAQSHRDLELIVLDDGSTDGTAARISEIKDDRLRLIRHEKNRGLIATLNHGLDLAGGNWIARMDADDLAHPDRFKAQLDLFREKPDLIACGTAMRVMTADGMSTDQTMAAYTGPGFLRWKILAGTVFHHPSVMFRAAAIRDQRYDEADRHAEDYGLWLRLSERGALDNVPRELVTYRVHAGSASHVHKNAQVESTVKSLQRHLRQVYGADFSLAALRLWAQPRFAPKTAWNKDVLAVLAWMRPSNPRFGFLKGADRRRAWIHYGRRLALIAASRGGVTG